MINCIKKIYINSAKLHIKLYKDRNGFKMVHIFLIALVFIFNYINERKDKSEVFMILDTVLGQIIAILFLLLILLVQFISITDDKGNFNLKYYPKYCLICSSIFTILINFICSIFNVSFFSFFTTNYILLVTYISVLFSFFSISWFSAILIFEFKSPEWIETKLLKLTAILTSINILTYFISDKYLVLSITIILCFYIWMSYIISDFKLQKNET